MPFQTEEQGGKLKPAGYKCAYTKEQAADVLVHCPEDPIYFIEKYCWIVHPVKGRVPFRLYEFQKKLINVYRNNQRVIASLSRQVGKTTTAAAFILWLTTFHADQKVIIASNKGASAKEIMDRIQFMYEEMPWFVKRGVDTWNVMSIKFDNNSQILAETTTATTARGKSPSMVYADEFAYVPPAIQDGFWTSLLPSLSEGGKCIITSTPNTDEDKFAKIWLNAIPDPTSDIWEDVMSKRATLHEDDTEEPYETIFETPEVKQDYEEQESIGEAMDDTLKGFVSFHTHWKSVPGRDEKFKRMTLASGITLTEWNRDFECSFLTRDPTLISPSKLLVLNKFVRPPRFIDQWGVRYYEEIKPNTAYGVVLDPSEGVELDDACIQVFEIPYLKQVAEWNCNTADQSEQTKMLARIINRIYNIQQTDPDHDGSSNIYYSVERNGLGVGILNSIEAEYEEKIQGWLMDSEDNKKRGLLTTLASKKRAAIEMGSLIERNLLIPRSRHLVSQLKTFVKKGQGYCAKVGSKDDIVMGCVLMMALLEEVRKQEPDLDERIHVEIDEYEEDDPNDPNNQYMPIFI